MLGEQTAGPPAGQRAAGAITPLVTGSEALRPPPRSLPRRFQNTILGSEYPFSCARWASESFHMLHMRPNATAPDDKRMQSGAVQKACAQQNLR